MDNHSGRNPNPRGVGNRKDFKDHTKLCAANKNYNKCSAVAEMGDRLATIDMGRKLKGVVPLLVGGGSWLPCNTMRPWPRPTFVPSGILIYPTAWPKQTWAEIWGTAAVPLGVELGPHLTHYCPGRGLPSYQVAPWSIQPFSHNKHRPKIGGLCPLFGNGELGPHLAQCGLSRGLPPYQMASRFIQPFGHNRHGPKIGGDVPPFLGRGDGSPSSTMWPTSIPSGILIHRATWPQQIWAEN